MGTWDAHAPTYVLRSTIWCPGKRSARLTISHPNLSIALVNGLEVDGLEVGSSEVDLAKGEKRILIIYPGCALGVATQRLTACFLRLSEPETGLRIQDIRYQTF